MSAGDRLIAELQIVLQDAEARAQVFRVSHACGAGVAPDDLKDHGMAVYAQLLDAMNVAQPGLGTAIHNAMNPLAGRA